MALVHGNGISVLSLLSYKRRMEIRSWMFESLGIPIETSASA